MNLCRSVATAAASAVLTLAGCANTQTHAVFATKTSLSLVDVDGSPAQVSFGYQRTEGYFGPKLSDGSVMPVVGFIETNGNLLDRSLKQIYAAGCAAETVAGAASSVAGSACTSKVLQTEQRPLLFVTGTTMGLGFGLGDGSGPSLALGYRRKEFSMIPVEPGSMPSVLATHGNEVSALPAGAPASRPEGKVGIQQFFATGHAANALAARPEIKDLFRSNADSALGTYRDAQRDQSEHAMTTLACLSRLPDARLPEAMRHAAALGVLQPEAQPSTLEQEARDAPAKARERYTRYLVLLNPDSADTTVLMRLHRQRVCELSKS